MELKGMSEGNGSKREKHNPNLGRCQNYNNRLGFLGKWRKWKEWAWELGEVDGV